MKSLLEKLNTVEVDLDGLLRHLLDSLNSSSKKVELLALFFQVLQEDLESESLNDLRETLEGYLK